MNLLPSKEERAQQEALRLQHRRRSALMQIYLPVGAGLLVLAAMAVLLFLLPGRTADNVIVTVLLLCPMSIGLFVIYVVLLLLVTGIAQGNRFGAIGLDKLNDLAFQALHFTRKAAAPVNESSIKFNAAVTPVTHVIKSIYDPAADVANTGHTKLDGTDGTDPR